MSLIKLPMKVLKWDLLKPPVPGWLTVQSLHGWEQWLALTFLPYSVRPWKSSWNLEVWAAQGHSMFPSLRCLQCLPVNMAALPQTSPPRYYPGSGLTRERKEAIVETSQGCSYHSKTAALQKLAFSSKKVSPPHPLLNFFLGKHLPGLNLQQFEEG